MSSGKMLPFSVEALLARTEVTSSTILGRNNKEPSPPTAGVSYPVYGSSTYLSGACCGSEGSDKKSETDSSVAKEDEVQVELCGKELWQEFYRIGNEMIITKAGRRMFPALKVKVSGLDPEAHYIMWVDVVLVDDNRYRYVYPSSQWMVAGTGDPPLPQRVFAHPDSPATGRHWMAQFISFDRLKLTNNKQPISKGQVSLHSMHKYQPRVHIQRTCDLQSDTQGQLDTERAVSVAFKETSFITVTAYQNQQITRLKIASNPFAKGFRDTIKSRDECPQYERSRPLALTRSFTEFPGVPSWQFPPEPYPSYRHQQQQAPFCNPTYYSPFCLMDPSAGSANFVLPYLRGDQSRTTERRTSAFAYHPSPHFTPRPPGAVQHGAWTFTPGVYVPTDFVPKM